MMNQHGMHAGAWARQDQCTRTMGAHEGEQESHQGLLLLSAPHIKLGR